MKTLPSSNLYDAMLINGRVSHKWYQNKNTDFYTSLCGLETIYTQIAMDRFMRICKKCSHSLEIRTPSQDDANNSQAN